MNDFTKEELEGILEALKFIDADPFIIMKIGWEDRLRTEIQSMIDNYDAKVIKAWHCEKCGHVQ